MTTRILFVCLGNICRSPTAEGVFRGLAAKTGADVTVDSAGTSGWHDGELPDRRSMAEAQRRGYDLSRQRSRRLTVRDFHDFDLILGMDNSNIRNIDAIRPSGVSTPVRLFLDYAPGQPLREVPDPYYEDNFEGVFDLIETASHGLLADIKG
ncbi:MAG: low molecular weight phosphotyrosine protein phosphatase [Rhodobacteraceae bacterium]|nr:low molecular weight phosphotyrosine protein phosphatase [Paracoccaceae bacterium]